MEIVKTFTDAGILIEGPILIKPRILRDERGSFYESWNDKSFKEALKNTKMTENEINSFSFVQDNHSMSKEGVVRGLHYQTNPYSQGKLVRCSVGEVYDIAVDLRRDSLTYAKWIGFKLSESNCHQLWIPAGFAHGFLSLKENSEIQYKTTNYWNASCEECLLWSDKHINIKWPSIHKEVILSSKDSEGKSLKNLEDENKLF